MTEFRTEEEQIAALKKWWNDNGKSLLIGIGLALVIVFGWKAYQNSVIQMKSEASALYQQLITEATNNNRVNEGEANTLSYLATEIKEKFESTEYAIYASLFMAKDAIQNNDYELAKNELNWVLSHSDDQRIQHIVKGRLARILSQQGNFQEALELLTPTLSQFKPAYLELVGDIKNRMGDKDAAIDAYKTAFALIKDTPQAQPFLAVKLSDLGVNPETL